jgi:hypothetical protein
MVRACGLIVLDLVIMISSSTTKLDSTPTSALGLPGGREQHQNPRTWSSGSEDICIQHMSPSPRPQQLVAMIGERKTLFCARDIGVITGRVFLLRVTSQLTRLAVESQYPIACAAVSKCRRSARIRAY